MENLIFLEGKKGNKEYKIYEVYNHYVNDKTLVPFDIPYNILKLYKKYEYRDGDLYKITYYKKCTLIGFGEYVYEEPVVEEERHYIRENGYLLKREMFIRWYYIDGELDTENVKFLEKFYSESESLIAGKKRREFIINNIKINVLKFICYIENKPIIECEQACFPFLLSLIFEIESFLNGKNELLIERIQNETEQAWLDYIIPGMDITIRQYIINYLLIA